MSVESTIAEINTRVASANITAMGYQVYNTQRALRDLPPYWEQVHFENIIRDFKISPAEVEAEIETARRESQ